jgi:hypothetical protein
VRAPRTSEHLPQSVLSVGSGEPTNGRLRVDGAAFAATVDSDYAYDDTLSRCDPQDRLTRRAIAITYENSRPPFSTLTELLLASTLMLQR